MKVRHVQQLGFMGGKPASSRRALTLRTVTVAARVVGDLLVTAMVTAAEMPAQSRGPAPHQIGQDPLLIRRRATSADVRGAVLP